MANTDENDGPNPAKYSLAWYERWVASDLSWYEQTILDEAAEEAERKMARNRSPLREPEVEFLPVVSRRRSRRPKKPNQDPSQRHITITELYCGVPKEQKSGNRPPVRRSLGYDCDKRKAEDRSNRPQSQSQHFYSGRGRPSYRSDIGGDLSSSPYSTSSRAPYVHTRLPRVSHIDTVGERSRSNWDEENVTEEHRTLSPFRGSRRTDSPAPADIQETEAIELTNSEDNFEGKSIKDIDFIKVVDACVAEQESFSCIEDTTQLNEPELLLNLDRREQDNVVPLLKTLSESISFYFPDANPMEGVLLDSSNSSVSVADCLAVSSGETDEIIEIRKPPPILGDKEDLSSPATATKSNVDKPEVNEQMTQHVRSMLVSEKSETPYEISNSISDVEQSKDQTKHSRFSSVTLDSINKSPLATAPPHALSLSISAIDESAESTKVKATDGDQARVHDYTSKISEPLRTKSRRKRRNHRSKPTLIPDSSLTSSEQSSCILAIDRIAESAKDNATLEKQSREQASVEVSTTKISEEHLSQSENKSLHHRKHDLTPDFNDVISSTPKQTSSTLVAAMPTSEIPKVDGYAPILIPMPIPAAPLVLLTHPQTLDMALPTGEETTGKFSTHKTPIVSTLPQIHTINKEVRTPILPTRVQHTSVSTATEHKPKKSLKDRKEQYIFEMKIPRVYTLDEQREELSFASASDKKIDAKKQTTEKCMTKHQALMPATTSSHSFSVPLVPGEELHKKIHTIEASVTKLQVRVPTEEIAPAPDKESILSAKVDLEDSVSEIEGKTEPESRASVESVTIFPALEPTSMPVEEISSFAPNVAGLKIKSSKRKKPKFVPLEVPLSFTPYQAPAPSRKQGSKKSQRPQLELFSFDLPKETIPSMLDSSERAEVDSEGIVIKKSEGKFSAFLGNARDLFTVSPVLGEKIFPEFGTSMECVNIYPAREPTSAPVQGISSSVPLIADRKMDSKILTSEINWEKRQSILPTPEPGKYNRFVTKNRVRSTLGTARSINYPQYQVPAPTSAATTVAAARKRSFKKLRRGQMEIFPFDLPGEESIPMSDSSKSAAIPPVARQMLDPENRTCEESVMKHSALVLTQEIPFSVPLVAGGEIDLEISKIEATMEKPQFLLPSSGSAKEKLDSEVSTSKNGDKIDPEIRTGEERVVKHPDLASKSTPVQEISPSKVLLATPTPTTTKMIHLSSPLLLDTIEKEVNDLVLEGKSLVDGTIPEFTHTPSTHKKKKKRRSRKSKKVEISDSSEIEITTSEESIKTCPVAEEHTVLAFPNDENKSETADVSCIGSSDISTKIDEAAKRDLIEPKNKSKGLATDSQQLQMTEIVDPVPSTSTGITHHVYMFDGVDPEAISFKDAISTTKKIRRVESVLRNTVNIGTNPETAALVRKMVRITSQISKAQEKMNAMVNNQKSSIKNAKSMKRLERLEEEIDGYRHEIGELRTHLALYKNEQVEARLSSSAASERLASEASSAEEILDTIETDTDKTAAKEEDMPRQFYLPMQLEVRPSSCALDTRRNLLDHFEETFNPIGDGNITSEFLKSWIFLKRSIYKNKPPLDVRSALKLVAQHRLDKNSVSPEIVNPPYKRIYKAGCPLTLKLVVPYGSTHMDIVVERNKKDYLINFHSISYSVFYDFKPKTIEFDVDPTLAVVNSMEGDYVYRFIALNRVNDQLYLVATKGQDLILLKMLYSPSFVVDEKFSSSESPEYLQFWYNNHINDAREGDDK